MTTWSMDTVRKVQRLGITWKVATIVADTQPGWHDHVQSQIAREIVEAARTLAVEVCPDDVAAIVRDSPADQEVRKREHAITLDGRWWPGWRTPTARLEVELRGGYYDGKVIPIFPNELERVQLPVPNSPTYDPAEVDMTGIMPAEHHQLFELSGWNEQDRRWVLTH